MYFLSTWERSCGNAHVEFMALVHARISGRVSDVTNNLRGLEINSYADSESAVCALMMSSAGNFNIDGGAVFQDGFKLKLMVHSHLTRTVFLVFNFDEYRYRCARGRRRGESGKSEERHALFALWKDGRRSGRALVRVSYVFVSCPRQLRHADGERVVIRT